MRPHILYLNLEPSLGAFPGPLESHVLQEVGHPVVLRGLVPTSGVDPHTHSCRRPVARLSGVGDDNRRGCSGGVGEMSRARYETLAMVWNSINCIA